MLAVSLSSLFGVFPIHTLVGVTHLHGVYTSLELLPETHPEAYIKGESTFSVGNDLTMTASQPLFTAFYKVRQCTHYYISVLIQMVPSTNILEIPLPFQSPVHFHPTVSAVLSLHCYFCVLPPPFYSTINIATYIQFSDLLLNSMLSFSINVKTLEYMLILIFTLLVGM